MRFPYGLAGFDAIRTRNMVYVDRTAYLRTLEARGWILVFLRPRRFGKSLWLSTLAHYYDVRRAHDFERLFGGLNIGADPTPERNQYFILEWDFSLIDPSGSVAQISDSLREHIRTRAETFVFDYREYLEGEVRLDGPPASILESLLRATRNSKHSIYLLVDEYDNFINEIMMRGDTVYQELIERDGPFKLLFKTIKAATQRGIDRVFMTGVLPVALNDLTGGFNHAIDVTHDPSLAHLCGFTAREVRALLARVAELRGLDESVIRETQDMMRIWYNGYRSMMPPCPEAKRGF